MVLNKYEIKGFLGVDTLSPDFMREANRAKNAHNVYMGERHEGIGHFGALKQRPGIHESYPPARYYEREGQRVMPDPIIEPGGKIINTPITGGSYPKWRRLDWTDFGEGKGLYLYRKYKGDGEYQNMYLFVNDGVLWRIAFDEPANDWGFSEVHSFENDNQIWFATVNGICFIVGGDQDLVSYDGGWGVDRIGLPFSDEVALSQETGAGNHDDLGKVDDGTYKYRFVYVKFSTGEDGFGNYYIASESPASAEQEITVSSSTTGTHIKLSNFPSVPDGYDGIWIYRTKANGDEYYSLPAYVPNYPGAPPSQLIREGSTYLDYANDSALGRGTPESPYNNHYSKKANFNKFLPESPYLIKEHNSRLYLVLDDYPNSIYYSLPHNPFVYDTQGIRNYFRMPADGDRVTALDSLSEIMIIYNKGSIYRWSGTGSIDFRNDKIGFQIGAVSQKAVANDNTVSYFYSPDNKIRATSGGKPEHISSKVDSYFKDVTPDVHDRISLAVWDDTLWVAYPSGDDNSALMMNLKTGEWMPVESTVKPKQFYVPKSFESDSMILSDYKADSGEGFFVIGKDHEAKDIIYDNESIVEAMWETGFVDLGLPTCKKEIKVIKGRCVVAEGTEAMRIEIFTDGATEETDDKYYSGVISVTKKSQDFELGIPKRVYGTRFNIRLVDDSDHENYFALSELTIHYLYNEKKYAE